MKLVRAKCIKRIVWTNTGGGKEGESADNRLARRTAFAPGI